jgi:putative methyltransferase (TIGR04325 family)
VPEGWAHAAANPDVKGWDVDAIADAYRRRWPSFVRAVGGSGPLGVAHEVPEGVAVPREERGAHNTVMSFAYVLARAAHRREELSLLDWGGGPGHYCLIARALLPDVPLDYHSKDVAKLAALGRELVPGAQFHDDDSCLDRRYALVVASGSLQYAEDWRGLLARLGAAAHPYLYVTRLPVALHAPSFVVVQRPYAYGYDTEYLGWVLSRGELLEAAEGALLRLEREFLLVDEAEVAGAPESPVQHRGFLFSRA